MRVVEKIMCKRGIFWVIDDTVIAVPFDQEDRGFPKVGNNYNHRLLWDYVKPPKCNKSFDYYPRGRVEIDNKGRPVIYLNPNIDERSIHTIIEAFAIKDEIPRIHYDGSEHYKCYLDSQYLKRGLSEQ